MGGGAGHLGGRGMVEGQSSEVGAGLRGGGGGGGGRGGEGMEGMRREGGTQLLSQYVSGMR